MMNANPLPLISTKARSLLSVPAEELLAWLQARRQPPMRARQIRRWLIAARATSFEQMTDLPLGLRQDLATEFVPFGSLVERHHVSSDGTEKLILCLRDGN